jgi:hypothetical protein
MLIETFTHRQVRFALALHVNSVQSKEAEFPSYELWSHQKQFVFNASERHAASLRGMIEARLSGGSRERLREELRRKVAEREKAAAGWTVDAEVSFDRFPRAHWITYEPSIKRVQIKVDHEQSADPKEYDAKVKTTSEAITYACALAGRPLALVGDLAWQTDNFSLLKLTCFILDRRMLDFERFRVLNDDPETWDFRYPELEAEVEGRS